jgi:hypothetical protein
MKVVLCGGGVCETVKDCPAVEILDDCVMIGEDDNMVTLTHEQFNILKEKVKNNEI